MNMQQILKLEEKFYEAIIQWDEGGGKRSRRELARRITAMIHQPAQQEPVAYLLMKDGKKESFWFDKGDAYDLDLSQGYTWVELYARPQAQTPLTDEQKKEMFINRWGEDSWRVVGAFYNTGIEDAEAAHGIKE